MKARTCVASTVALLLLVCAVLAAAEEKRPERNVFVQRGVYGDAGMAAIPFEGPFGGPVIGDRLMFVSSEMVFDNKLVKGVPYQAESVSEHSQVLADGNRITRRNAAAVYRDSEGRTRREQNLSAIGPWTLAGGRPRTVFINDPIADVNYILDPDNRTARKVFASMMKAKDTALHAKIMELKKQHPGEEVRIEVRGGAASADLQARFDELKKHHPGERVRVEIKNGVESVDVLKGEAPQGDSDDKFTIALPGPNARTEQLGRRIVEGVEADGTRTVVIIAAGEIGNERPIEIVTESWYSPDLQVIVMSRHSDPRLGENVYRLSKIQRVEPAPTLFQVPSDYTIKEGKEVIHELLKFKGEKK